MCVCFEVFTYCCGIVAGNIGMARDRGMFQGTVERHFNKKSLFLTFAAYRQHGRVLIQYLLTLFPIGSTARWEFAYLTDTIQRSTRDRLALNFVHFSVGESESGYKA